MVCKDRNSKWSANQIIYFFIPYNDAIHFQQHIHLICCTYNTIPIVCLSHDAFHDLSLTPAVKYYFSRYSKK